MEPRADQAADQAAEQGPVRGRAEKSPSAFRTISEVSAALDLPQHILRFWETKFPQLRPLKRGGGRRYYRPEDIELLRGIRTLLYDDGYTIKGVRKLLRESGAKALVAGSKGAEAAVVAPVAAAAGLDGKKRVELEAALAELQKLKGLLRDSNE